MHMISFIIPLYNNEDSLQSFCRSLINELVELPVSYECIFIDNASHDHTLEKLRMLCEKDFHFNYISTKYNNSILTTLYLGLQHTQGEIIITMDINHPTYMINHFYNTIIEKQLLYAGGLLFKNQHSTSSKKQKLFKVFDRSMLEIFIDTEDYDGFCSFMNHLHEDMYLIPYTDLAKKEESFFIRYFHKLNFYFGHFFIYTLLITLCTTILFIPSILILYFHLDIIYTLYICSLLTICVFALLYLLRSRYCCLNTQKKLTHIKESTFP